MQEVGLVPSQSHDLPLRWPRTHSLWVRPETKKKIKNGRITLSWKNWMDLRWGNPKVCTHTDPGKDAFLLESASDQCLQVHHFPRVVVHFSLEQLTHQTTSSLFLLLLLLLPSSVLWMCAIANIHRWKYSSISSMTLEWSDYGPARFSTSTAQTHFVIGLDRSLLLFFFLFNRGCRFLYLNFSSKMPTNPKYKIKFQIDYTFSLLK